MSDIQICVWGWMCIIWENCNYENRIFAGFEPRIYGVLAGLVLLIMHELTFCVRVSYSFKKKCAKCASPHVNNWQHYIGLICTHLVHDHEFWKLLLSMVSTRYVLVNGNKRINWNRPRSPLRAFAHRFRIDVSEALRKCCMCLAYINHFTDFEELWNGWSIP
jgi:hypothetical protein